MPKLYMSTSKKIEIVSSDVVIELELQLIHLF